MRLDVYLCEAGLSASRTEAKRFITEGAVRVNGHTVTKPSAEIVGGENISVDRSGKLYVSRGGLKLRGALGAFSLPVEGRMALDIGASSGGFTDCLLQHGAAHVIAVDSGSGQMAESLRRDARVTVIENFNARYMQPTDFAYVPTLAVMDVSFISATLILPALYTVLADGADLICLVKPQFEVGRAAIGKGGIVKDERARKNALAKVIDAAAVIGFSVLGCIPSPIPGGDGNLEYLVHFRKNNGCAQTAESETLL